VHIDVAQSLIYVQIISKHLTIFNLVTFLNRY